MKSTDKDGVTPRTNDRVQAHLFNYDGRRENIFPPDVENPNKLHVGTLLVEEVDSAWGTYTRHAVIVMTEGGRPSNPTRVLLFLGGREGATVRPLGCCSSNRTVYSAKLRTSALHRRFQVEIEAFVQAV